MDRSLSVLLPVRNVQSTLVATVHEFLEVLPDLTSHFELVIIDDGSTDSTIEVADELANQYPQVRILRHSPPLGRAGAINAGLDESTGEVVFLRDEDCRLPIGEVQRLWRSMDHHEIAVGRAPLESWPGDRQPADARRQGGFQMLRRTAVGPLRQSLHHQTALVHALARLADRWHEVEIPAKAGEDGLRTSWMPRGHAAKADRSAVAKGEQPGRPSRPNYLTRLRDFALGE